MNHTFPKFSLFFGVFSLMALSNAIIPILPNIDSALHIQSYIYSAYFFGGMISTLPGGILCDKIGQQKLIYFGFLCSLLSGSFLLVLTQPVTLIFARLIEGVGAGLFVTASLSWINQRSDHISLSGLYMALLNLGLLLGLLCSGWIANSTEYPKGGMVLFFIISLLAFLLTIYSDYNQRNIPFIIPAKNSNTEDLRWGFLLKEVRTMMKIEAPLWFSVIILLGTTGFVQAVYPELSNKSAFESGSLLAIMNVATIITTLLASRIKVEPVLLIRVSAVMIGGLVLVFLEYPISIFFMGLVAGLLMISQINYLAFTQKHQGIAMGLFSTATYAGMTFIPAFGGTIIKLSSVFHASICISILALISGIIIGRCRCKNFNLSDSA